MAVILAMEGSGGEAGGKNALLRFSFDYKHMRLYDARLMQKVKLPIAVDPVKCAQKALEYEGILGANQVQRLAESTAGVNSDVEARVSFSIDAQGLAVIEGTASVAVTLECQRCNELFQHQCVATFLYSPVKSASQAEQLPEAYEPIELDEFGELALHDLIEDELILALPLVAMHPPAECSRGDSEMVYGELKQADERPNPFAVLEKLKRK